MEFPAPPRVHVLHVPGADPDRDAIVAKLQREADACLHLDPERKGLMPNWLGALDCAYRHDVQHEGYSWSLILSDDADPLPGWQQHVERACTNSPAPLLGLTHFGAYGQHALARDRAYGVGPYLLWGGAIAIKAIAVGGLLSFATRVYETTGYPHDDVLTCAYAMQQGWQTAMTARAIFDQPVKASLLNHNTPIRRPATTILNSSGPDYRLRPNTLRVSRGISPRDELSRLAAL